MHAQQGFEYAFPDLADPLFVSKLVVEDGAGCAVMASLARLTCEMYLLVAPGEGNPCERYARLLALHQDRQRPPRALGQPQRAFAVARDGLVLRFGVGEF